jgi:phospholipid N-methyltransferase
MSQNTIQREKWLFFSKFLKQGRRIASFVPSTEALAQACCRYINPDIPQVILELGAGTGAITEIALTKMHPKSTLIAVEADPDFSLFLQQRCPTATVLNCTAQDILKPLMALNIYQVDVILNGLPTPSMTADINQQIMKNCQILIGNRDIPISQITLMPWVYLRMYQQLFKHVDFQFVLKSFPPGGIYHCRQFRLS